MDAGVASSTLGVSIGVLALNLVGGIALARSLGVDGRGQVAALILWATLAMDLAMVGTNASTTYHIARSPSDRGAVIGLLKRAVPVMALAGLVIYLGFAATSDLSAPAGALVIFATYVPLRILLEQMLAIVQGENRFGRYNRARLVVAGLPAAGFLAAWLAGVMSVTGAGLGYAVSVTVGMAVLADRRRTQGRGPRCRSSHCAFDRRGYWSYSIRNWFATLAAKGNSNVDVLILSILATTGSLGLYAVSISAASLLTLVGTAAGIVALPRLAAAPNSGQAATIYRTLLTFTIVGTALLAGVLFVTAGLVVPLVFGEDFRDAVPLVRILAVGYVGVSLAGFAAAVLRSRNRPGTVAIAQGVGLAITVGLAVATDPRSGATVAVASVLGFWASALIQILAVRRGHGA
jgi:O-antigen/teichoic acid export membrane protein